MRKLRLLLAFLLLLVVGVQCTDEDDVERAQYETLNLHEGEEGDQELDSERD